MSHWKAWSRFLWVVLPLVSVGCDGGNRATVQQVMTELSRPVTPAQQATRVEEGEILFLRRSCQNCHAIEGAARGAPRLRNLYTSRAKLIDGTEIVPDREYLVRSILHPQAQVVAGYPQRMSNYGFLPAEEVAALVAYLESLSPGGDGSPSASVP